MGAWTVPYAVALLVLALAGVAKAVSPTMTAGALRRAGLPGTELTVRVGGVAEATLALVAGATGAVGPALAVAGSYVVFAAFVVMALWRRLPIGSCGCVGRLDTPPSGWHVLVDLLGAGAALGAASVAGPDRWLGLGDRSAGTRTVTLAASAAGAVLVVALLARRPRAGRGRG